MGARYFSLVLSTTEEGLGGHKNRGLFKSVVEEAFFNKSP
jgi:hypothetical protein